MTIIRNKSRERRRDRRRQVKLVLEYQATEYEITDCSLGGLAIACDYAPFPPDGELTADIKIPSGDDFHVITVPLKVVRYDPKKREAGFHFMGLDDASFSALESHLTGRNKA